ncbi:LysR family transcriptional regulator [Azospirillum sp. sgz301742]
MRLRHIEVFHAVMRTGSVSAAAKLLNVSQPAVTKLVRAAEAESGLSLFRRVKGRLYPTPEAERLFLDVEKVFESLEELRSLTRSLRDGRSGHLRVACTPALALDVLPRAVACFRTRAPGVSLGVETLHARDMVMALLARDIDVVFGFELPSHPGVQQEWLGRGELLCATPAGTPSPAGGRMTLRDLGGRTLIALSREDPLGLLLRTAALEQGIELLPDLDVQTYHVALSLAAAGAGTAIVDSFTARAGAATVSCWPFAPPLAFDVRAAWARNRPPRRLVGDFIAMFRELITS